MKFLIPALVLSASFPAAFSQEQIIPKPAEITLFKGSPARLTRNSFIITATQDKAFLNQAGQLQQMLSEGTGLPLPLKTAGQASKKAACIIIKKDPSLAARGEEAYSIQSSPGGIILSAADARGIFYAGQSLVQMMPAIFHDGTADKSIVPWNISETPFRITDYPRFSWRALMIDEARHFFGEKTIKQIIDQMALLKMNILHWHLTDDTGWRIEIKKYPLLTSIGSKRRESEIGTWNSGKSDGTPHEGFYTQEQIRDIVQYAARRNITVVPEIEMPGHASAAAAAYPFLSLKTPVEVPTTFIVNTAFDPTSEKTYAFLSDVLDEIAALFPGKIIHIGGDEVRYDKQWKGVPEIEEFMKKNGMKNYADVQMYFTNRMSGIIAQKGRRMMGWNEIYGHDVNGDGGGKAGAKLDTNAVIQFWKGNTGLAKNAIRDGHDVINSLHTSTYLDYSYGSIPLQKAYGFEPVFPGLEEQYHSRVKGLGTQVWTEWIATPERLHYQAFPRVCAFAEVGWTPAGNKDFPDFKKRLKAYSEHMDLMGIKFARNIISQIDKSDFFNTPRIGTWTPAVLTGQEHSFDVTKLVRAPGKYTVTLLYDKGAHAIEIESVALYENSREISRDAHAGRSGAHKENIQYILNAPEPRQGATYTVKAKFKGAGGRDSHGTVYFEAP
ncbi:beta-N-acetylhexosaminidase [Akkermansia muciniphila]|uniref:beta-N-acetylhexosaminidase n=1 Tax=Akkermansia muciniphila TaxID=239935 RepID=UPI0027D24BF9|nr:beta-N-acetylhexosaminidase [Akkermansia muciniphila]WMB15701.1 beta-N-acetylhexosaminidase [Akkermansia muciniphila]WMB20276.1 beta-N-acetylhexosaminidase [Akkermansia muciniphila]